MEFMNRKEETKFIEESKSLSESKLFSLCVFGPRRVGKTRLILESLRRNDLYFFVNKDKTTDSLLKEYEDALKSKNVLTGLESLKTWEDFFKVLFTRYNGVAVFDEFQNFNEVDKAVFGILQKNFDLHENRKNLMMLFSGSTIGMIKKIFFDKKEPLYGRLKRKMEIKPLPFHEVVKICKKLDIGKMGDIVTLYSIFGGFPKYYVSIEDERLNGKNPQEIFERFFFEANALFEDEVNTILSMEFGKRKGVYYDILGAVSSGNTRVSEVASYLGKKETSFSRQMDELVNYFNIIGIKKQAIGKKTLMFIDHPLMNFWFKFFYKDISQYKRRENSLINKIKENLNAYVGRKFEGICIEMLPKLLPFDFEEVGNQWGKVPSAPKDKNQYEIDIIALSKKTKEILFCECKWEDKVDTEKLIKELIEKSKYVQWNNENRKESFALFAKSFKNKIDELEGKKVYCFDLKDLEKILN